MFFKKFRTFQKFPRSKKYVIFKILRFSKIRNNENYVFLKKTCFKGIKRTNDSTFLSEIMATNTLGEFSDGEDDFVFQIDESSREWSDPERKMN